MSDVSKAAIVAGSPDQSKPKPCIMNDILDRLPETVRNWVESARPEPHVAHVTPEQASACHADILKWLLENRNWIFPPTSSCHCVTHDAQCYVHPAQVLRNSGNSVAVAKDNRNKIRWIASSTAAAGPGANSSTTSASTKPVICNSAGTSCVGWSPSGSRLKQADPSDVAHSVWVVERKVAAERLGEDVVFQENSWHYDFVEKFDKPLKETHLTLQLKWTPEEGGFPLRRQRSYGAGLNRCTMAWLGPTDLDGVRAHFGSFFQKQLASDGDVWLVASAAEVQSEKQRLAKLRGFHIADDALGEFDALDAEAMLSKLLPPGQVQRYQAHEKNGWSQVLAAGSPTWSSGPTKGSQPLAR